MKNFNAAAVFASALLIGVPAFAQVADPVAPVTPPGDTAPATPAPDAGAPLAAPDATAPAATIPDATVTGGTAVPEGYTPVTDWSTLTADQLNGTSILAADGSSVGKISDLELAGDGSITGLIVDVGGFLGIGVHTVKLGVDQVSLYSNADAALVAHTALNEDALKAMPEYTPPAG